jgi:transcriptional regulator with XRE-family HTH domain
MEKEEYNFHLNLTLIRSVWKLSQTEFGKLIFCTAAQIGNYERGHVVNYSPTLLFDLEDITHIPARRLYYALLTRKDIPYEPFPRTAVETATPVEGDNVVHADVPEEMLLVERVKRLEAAVFGR